MNLSKHSCITRAIELLEKDNPISLRYACLEMRYCIEAICYDKARLYKKHLPDDVLEKWQPRKLIEALVEFDPYANQNFSMNIWSENPDGSKNKLIFSGAHMVLPFIILKKHYNRLGSYLHAPTLSQDKERNSLQTYKKLKDYLGRLIEQIRESAENTFDSNVAVTVSANCQECGQFLIRNAESLKDNPIVKCTNTRCQAEYDVRVEENASRWKLRTLDAECPVCKTKFFFGIHFLREGNTIKCVECNQKYIIGKEWVLLKTTDEKT